MKKLIVIALAFVLTACSPTIKGLPAISHAIKSQEQAELFWQSHSFAFLLSQETQDTQTSILALTLSGQVLFELNYDGKKLHTLQKDPKLKALPVGFLVRDIWWATRPPDELSDLEQLGLKLIIDGDLRTIDEQGKPKLTAQRTQDGLLIENKDVPYRIILSQSQNFIQ